MVTKVAMPKLSLTMKTGTVIKWHKEEGETVQKGEPVVEVLSEKITYDVEASASGTIRILVEEGEEIAVGATLAFIGEPNEELPKKTIVKPSILDERELMEKKEVETPISRKRIIASPAAKRLAAEHKIDISEIQEAIYGTIRENDVKRLIEEREILSPKIKEKIPLTGIRKTTAERVTSSFQTVPHSYIVMDVDMTQAMRVRKRIEISYTAIIVSAVAKALTEHSVINSKIAGNEIQVFDDINIGVAVSTEKGLVVPVIKNADKKQLPQISRELDKLAEETRKGRLAKEQLTGGTFTVTNLGMYDVDMFIPIINPPEAAILAAGNVSFKPVIHNDEIMVKPVLTLTLAYDHRIVDGAPASIFLRRIKEIVENIETNITV